MRVLKVRIHYRRRASWLSSWLVGVVCTRQMLTAARGRLSYYNLDLLNASCIAMLTQPVLRAIFLLLELHAMEVDP